MQPLLPRLSRGLSGGIDGGRDLGTALSPAMLRSILTAELMLLDVPCEGGRDNGGNATLVSAILGRGGSEPAVPLKLETLTEFDRANSTSRDGQWVETAGRRPRSSAARKEEVRTTISQGTHGATEKPGSASEGHRARPQRRHRKCLRRVLREADYVMSVGSSHDFAGASGFMMSEGHRNPLCLPRSAHAALHGSGLKRVIHVTRAGAAPEASVVSHNRVGAPAGRQLLQRRLHLVGFQRASARTSSSSAMGWREITATIASTTSAAPARFSSAFVG